MLRSLRLFVLTLVSVLRARLSRGALRPGWSFMFEGTRGYLRRDWDETSDWPFARLRADMNARPYPKDFARRVVMRALSLGGVDAFEFVPPKVRRRGAVLFFHGGSYIYGSAATTHAELLARLAFESGARVVGVDYRLAPEHPYPAQRDDALAAFDALVASGVEAKDVVLAGDSAGANLALVTQIALRERGGAQAAGLALLSPWTDLTMPGASFETHDKYDFGTREVLLRQARAFAGDISLEDPRVSPTYASLEGLAPTLIQVGEVEALRDDIESLAARMKNAGVDVTLFTARDMPHNAAMFAALHPSGAEAMTALVRFVESRLCAA